MVGGGGCGAGGVRGGRGAGGRGVDCFGKSRSAGFGRHFCFLAVFSLILLVLVSFLQVVRVEKKIFAPRAPSYLLRNFRAPNFRKASIAEILRYEFARFHLLRGVSIRKCPVIFDFGSYFRQVFSYFP